MKMGTEMPISLHWSTEEVVDAIHFFQAVEKVHGEGMKRESFLELYRRFKEIVPSKSEEKQLFKQFDKQTGVSCYHAVKRAKEQEQGSIVRR